MIQYEVYQRGKIEGSFLRAVFNDVYELERYIRVLPNENEYFIVKIVSKRTRYNIEYLPYLIENRKEE